MKLLLIAPLLVAPNSDDQEAINTYDVYDRLMDFGETTRSLDIRFSHTVYDHVFKRLTLTKGRVYWESSARWTVYEEPVEPRERTRQVRGREYEVVAGQSTCWLRDGRELAELDFAAGKRQVRVNEEPDETGIASTIRVLAAVPQMADFNPYSMTSKLQDGKVRVDLEPTRPVHSAPILFGASSMRLTPPISMLLDKHTLRPTAVRMTDQSKENTYVIEREVRNVVPPDRDEVLFPCPWIFEASPPKPTPTYDDYSMTFGLIAGFVRLLAPGL